MLPNEQHATNEMTAKTLFVVLSPFVISLPL